MGGLAGLIDLGGDAVSPSVLGRMLGAVAHRGPDGQGQFTSANAAFGHARRSLSNQRGMQPLVTDEIVLMLDGWIYDHTLPQHLMGPSAPNASDSTTLLAAWKRWGRDFVDHVEGDFAVAVWERHEQRLHLFRDRFGVRPLFWARKGSRFGFASSLRGVLPMGGISTTPDPTRLAEYLSFQVVHAPRTLLADVQQVEPGHWLQLDADGLKTRRWWAIHYAPPGTPRPSDATVLENVSGAVQRSVRRRVAKDVRTGLYLSGGLGSTAIAAASRRLHLDLPTFTISFADDPYPELPFAGRVARLLGLEHHEVVVGSADVAAAFAPTVAAMGHPVGNPTGILQYLLARHASTQVDVVLAGDGGPELFGGRMLDKVLQLQRTSRLGRRLPGAAKRLLRRALGDRGERLTTPPESVALIHGLGGANLFSTEARSHILANRDWVRPTIRQDVLSLFHANLHTDPINTALHGYLRSWLGEGALARADGTAAAGGVDARFPLLDLDIVSYATGLPGEVKIRRVGGGLHTRWPLRAMLDGVLPAPLVNRPRRGMASPPDVWLSQAGRLFFESRFIRLRDNRTDLFDPDGLTEMRARLAGDPAVGLRFWALFVLDEWLDGLR